MNHTSILTHNHTRHMVGISVCLMGSEVCYDGSHERNRYCTDVLQTELDLIPVCPDVEVGLGIPRPTIHIRPIEGEMRLTHTKDGSMDMSDAIRSVADRRAESLGPLSGFILKRKSPSCGMERVPVTRADGQPRDRSGMGVFAKRFAELRPLVPLEEEGRLNDPILRDNFLERVYALHRWHHSSKDDAAGFTRFHASHKLMLMVRGSTYHSQLGRIVAASPATTWLAIGNTTSMNSCRCWPGGRRSNVILMCCNT